MLCSSNTFLVSAAPEGKSTVRHWARREAWAEEGWVKDGCCREGMSAPSQCRIPRTAGEVAHPA